MCQSKANNHKDLLIFQLKPENVEEYIDYLVSIDRLDDAAIRLANVINEENFVSKAGKSKHTVGQ